MSSSYSLVEVTDKAAWDGFNKKSPQGTVFSTTTYLEASKLNYRLYFVQKGSIIHGGILILLDDKNERVVAHDLVVYNGILFIENSMDQNNSKRSSFEFEITTYVIEQLTQKYQSVSLALATTFKDLRPFSWHNYGQTRNTFQLNLRYTSELRLDGELQETESNKNFMDLGTSRRQEIRAARKANCSALEVSDINILIDLYIKNMTSKGNKVDEDFTSRMRNIGQALLADKKGHLFIIKNESGDCLSAALFAHHGTTSYYVWGANDPGIKDNYSGTIILWDSFKKLQQLGIKKVDLEGVNSPKRGWFKLSFGGELVPYFEVHYRNEDQL